MDERCVVTQLKSSASSSHMDALELCKLNLQSLDSLTTAEKYLPQINIVATAPVIKPFRIFNHF